MEAEVKFKGRNLSYEWTRYESTMTPALVLYTDEEGYREPFSKATVNVPEEALLVAGITLDPMEIVVRDHAENEGMVRALEAAGIAKSTGRVIRSGYVNYPIMRLTLKAAREMLNATRDKKEAEEEWEKLLARKEWR